MSAGELRERITFSRQLAVDTSYGGTVGDWEDQFTVPARITPLTGSEPVKAQRLAGIQPVIIKIRSSSDTRLIQSSWLATDPRTGIQYQILTVTPDERRAYIEILAQAGGANNG